MPKLEFSTEWQSGGAGPAELRETSAFLTLRVANAVVTRNEDIWSKTIRDSVLVSTYPLAMWLAASWWRLNWEPLPNKNGPRPGADWRMAHEMGAAHQGYVWPHVLFASDNEVMQIWATAPDPSHEQSVRYLTQCSATMPLDAFKVEVDGFVNAVVRRLAAVGCADSDLARLWNFVQADRSDPVASRYRKIEAALGYDPDECPQELMDQAVSFDREMGGTTLAELAPVYGKSCAQQSLAGLAQLRDRPGLLGTPALPKLQFRRLKSALEPPWVRAVAAANALRKQLGLGEGRVENSTLRDLLGLGSADNAAGDVGVKDEPGLGIPQAAAGQIKFIPRKRHPVGRRFELSRFIADLVLTEGAPQWLASTDLPTARQKFQRAFAAEFLCPIDSLAGFLQGNYSESSIERAAGHFDVSEKTVESLLTNNRLIEAPWMSDAIEVRPPYSLSAQC